MPTTHLVKKSKKMIRDMGNVELFELCENNSKSAMLRMPSLLESRNSLLHLSMADWVLSQSRTMSSRRCDQKVRGRLKLRGDLVAG